MKTKHILLLGVPPFILAFCFLEWHLSSLSSENENTTSRQGTRGKTSSSIANNSSANMLTLPANTPSTSETPEMKNARIMAKARSDFAKVAPLIEAFKGNGVQGVLSARMDRLKPEYMAFLQSLGLAPDLCEKVFQMLKVESELAVSNMAEKRASMQRGEGTQGEAFQPGRQIMNELEDAVGKDNFDQIRYWQATQQEREKTQAYKIELASQALSLSADKEAVVIDALHQARKGDAWFALNNPHASTQQKMAYVTDVRSRLVSSLSKAEMQVLTEYLTQIATRPLLPSY